MDYIEAQEMKGFAVLAQQSGFKRVQIDPQDAIDLIDSQTELVAVLREVIAGDEEAIADADAMGVPFPDELLTAYKKAKALLDKHTAQPIFNASKEPPMQ